MSRGEGEGGVEGQTKRRTDGPSTCSLGDGPLREKTLGDRTLRAKTQKAEREKKRLKEETRAQSNFR